jgi:hypothetical protein
MRIITLLLFLSSTSLFSQKEYAKSILDTLCSPHFDGRGYVNNGDVRAADFIVDELKRIGVQQFKNKEFTQDYTLNVNTFPYPIEVVLGEDTLEPGADYLVDAISGTAQGEFDLVEINPENYLSTYGGNIDFKLLDPSQTVFAFNFTEVKNKELLNQIRSLSYYASMYFPVILVTTHKQMYSVGRDQSNYPIITVDSSAYNKTEKVKLKINNKYIPKYESKNVIGVIPGKKKKKYIVFSAHYDHLGRMGEQTYFPGGNDNASGVAMLLSIAKYYMKNPPKYSIAFCFFSGEEAGLEGSKYFVSHPYFKLRKVKFVINIDIMGGAGKGITVVNGSKHEESFNRMVEINETNKLLGKVSKRGPTANSDHYHFSESGVPAFFIYSVGNVKNYHDIYDTAKNTPLTKFNEVQQLVLHFANGIK